MNLLFTIFILDAIHIAIIISFCRNFIGHARVNKKMLLLFGVVFWGLSCFLRLMPASQKCSGANAFLWLAEMMFLLLISFFYHGKMIKRFVCAVFLPALYWGGQWMIATIVFGSAFASNKECIICTFIMLILIGLFDIFTGMVRKSKQDLEREMLEQEIRIYENQFDVIRNSQKNIRSLRHDLRHHIKMLTDMIENNEKEAALKYLSSMGVFMENTEEYVSSGNERIDSILNYMISRARAEEIKVEWKVQIPEHLEISTFDINVILSNLFDNAFNALKAVETPWLNILIKYDRGILCITMQNNGAAEAKKSIEYKSLLEEISEEHGYGLKNVSRISEKYHGNLSLSCEQGVFHVCVLLFLSDVLLN